MEETILYLLYNPKYHAVKVGIAHIGNSRYKALKTDGWSPVAYWHFSGRDKARAVESLVLNTLRIKYGHYLSKEQMPYGGYTETFDANKITKTRLVRLVNKAIKLVNQRD
jgi:hypothetical protein